MIKNLHFNRSLTRILATLAFAFFMLTPGWGQTSTQNFGTSTGSYASQTGTTTFIPNPTPASSGTTYARAGNSAANATINLVTASNPLGTTGAYARAVASTSTSCSKMSPIVGYTNGTSFYTKMKVLFGNSAGTGAATSGTWQFVQGAGSNFSDNQLIQSTQVFTGLRFTFGASSALTLDYFNSSGNWISTNLTSTALAQATVYTIEIVGNNATSGTINYTYNGVSKSVAFGTFDLYINGAQYGSNLSKGALSAGNNVNAMQYIGISSTSNAANLFVDDVEVYNSVPATIGSGGATPPTLTAATGTTVDAPFDVTFPDDAAWRAAITSIKVGATTLTAGSLVSAGQITFTPSASAPAALLQTAGSPTITVVATGYSDATVVQALGAGAANKLVMNIQPTAPATNGAVLGTQPSVYIRDQYGNATTSTASVSAAVGAGTWSLGGTATINAGSGTAAFSVLTATSAAAVSGATIAFTSSGLTPVTSAAFSIPAPAPANDNCAGAIALTINASAITGDVSGATQTLAATCAGTADDDVWYSFTTGASGIHAITVAGSTSFDAVVELRSGTCNGTSIACTDATGSGGAETITQTLAASTTYLVRVYSYIATVPATTTFNIAVSGPVDAPVAAPATSITSEGFSANWNIVPGATGYRLDVATTNSFTTGSTVPIVSQGFNNSASNFSVSGGTYYTGNSGSGDRPATSPFAIEGTHSIGRNSGTATLTSNAFDVSSYSSLELSFRVSAFSIGSTGNGMDAGDIVTVEISPDNGTTYFSTLRVLGNSNAFWAYSATGVASTSYDGDATPVNFQPAGGGSRTTDGYSSVNVTGLPSSGSLKVRITMLNNDGSELWVIDDFKITGTLHTMLSGYNNLTVSGLTQTVSGLTPNTNYYYRVRAVSGSNTSANSNTITVVTLNPAPEFTTFTGTGNWTDLVRWDFGIPSVTLDAKIGGDATINTDVEVTNLTINNGGKLTIANGGTLTVTGLTNEASNEGLVIKSGGSLISTSEDVAATVEKYITQDKYHSFSPSISNAKSGMFYVNGIDVYLYSHSEVNNAQIINSLPTGGYNEISSLTESLVPMSGYSVYSMGSYTFIEEGPLNSGPYSKSLTRTGTGSFAGFNYVGNPYPSFINWDHAAMAKTDLTGAVYVENGLNWATYTAPGPGVNGGSNIISPGQGFFVEVLSSETTGSLGMENDVRTHTSTPYLKSTPTNYVRLIAEGNGKSDETVVRFDSDATAQYDGQFDATKLSANDENIPQIYSITDRKLAYNALPETNVVQLGFNAGISGTYSISINDIADLHFVTLEDTKTGIFAELAVNPYTFIYNKGENEQRFKLHFSSVGVDEKETTSANIYSYQQSVYVNLTDNTQGDIYIYNLAGQLVTAKESASGNVRIGLTSTGVYMVKVVTQKETLTQKVVIR